MSAPGRPAGPAAHAAGDVAIVLASFGSGGAERVLLNVAAGLCDRGIRVRILVLDATGPLRDGLDPRVELVELGRRRARTAGPRIVRVLRSDPPDAVLASQRHVNVLLGLLRPVLPSTCRLVVREPLLRPDRTGRGAAVRLAGRLLARADVIVASSDLMVRHLRPLVGTTPVVRLPNPVDVGRLRHDAPVDPVGTPGTSRTAEGVVVGRLVPQKGHDDLLDALAAADTTPLRLTIIGDGPLRGDLEAACDRLGLRDRVTFTGRIDDRRDLAGRISRADVLVHPARFEGMPNTVLEALALGTPVLATEDLGMLAELAGRAGPGAIRLVPRGALAEALAATGPRPGPRPGPNLLPEEHTLDRVVGRLAGLLLDGPSGEGPHRPRPTPDEPDA